MSILSMTLNCIWRIGFSPAALGSVVYPLITIIPRSTLTQNGKTYKGPVCGSSRDLLSFIWNNLTVCKQMINIK